MIALPNWDFKRCLAASFALHVVFFFLVNHPPHFGGGEPPVEIDLTNPLIGTGPAKLGAPKRLIPNAPPVPARPVETPKPPEPVPTPPKDWTLPGPNTKKVEKQPEDAATPGGTKEGTGTSPLPGGSGAGANYGSPNGTGNGGSPAIKPPRLLNRDELLANLRKYYPPEERRAGHEGSVMVYVHIGADGSVTGTDVAVPASAAFNAAAQKVANLMKFAPAEGPQGPVPVKILQAIVFRLTD